MRRGFDIPRGFTLIELLVVIGIIAVLIGILLPVLASAQRSAKDVQCRSNMRQVAAALLNYATDNKGKFPPNIERLAPPPSGPPLWNYWADADRIGKYLPFTRASRPPNNNPNGIGGPAWVCPQDTGAGRSYSMNYFASSAVNTGLGGPIRVSPPHFPATAGQAWGPHAKGSGRLILVIEGLSAFTDGWGSHMASQVLPIVGNVTSAPILNPGSAFVGAPGVVYDWHSPDVRYMPTESMLDWSRHRRRGDGGTRVTEARGRMNIAFADGHVASYASDEVVDRVTRKSKLVALWSPLDAKFN